MTQYEWIDKVIDLHRKHGIRELDLSHLRQINKHDALEAAAFLYEDMIANSDLYPEYVDVIRELRAFSADDKPKAIGTLLEVNETCGKECNIQTLMSISKNWDLSENKLFTLLKSF